MTSGARSNAAKSAKWRGTQRLDGKKRIGTTWIPGELYEELSRYAVSEMVPTGVAIEMILKKHLEGV
jgi:hypothetical protein